MKFSPLMLGTVQFGLNYGIANVNGKPSYETAKEILKTAYDLGITALDTAAAYGDSEEVLGKALTELGIKDKVTVVTKVPPIPENTDPEKFIKESLISSLKRLKLDVLPVVLIVEASKFFVIDEFITPTPTCFGFVPPVLEVGAVPVV
jgi:aryl-alcohol dehydrogenase-like predicted oxidoreductase